MSSLPAMIPLDRRWALTLPPYILAGLFFFVVLIGLARFSLHVPFFEDDLHLVRLYSPDELQSVWQGPWDPDGLETRGFRPLTTWFNHLRASLFGDSVGAHRLLLLALFAVYLSMAAALARRMFNTAWAIGLLGGLLTALHVSSVFHYAWIADGIHLLQGIFILCAILFALRAVATGRTRWLFVSLLCIALAMLTREDSVVVYPLTAFFVAVDLIRNRRWRTRRPVSLALYAAGGIGLFAVYWGWRVAVVPNATALQLSLGDWAWSMAQIVQNLGDRTNLVVWWPEYILLIDVWLVCLGILVAVVLFALPRPAQHQAAFWAAALAIGALPGLTLARTNLLLIATTFWGLCLSSVLMNLSKRSTWSWLCAVAIAVFVLWSSATGSAALQTERNPASLEWICGETSWIYGPYSHVTIPEPRHSLAAQRLYQFGISSAGDLYGKLPDLIDEALTHHRYAPNDEGRPFIPRFAFIVYPGWSEWSCVTQPGGVYRKP